MSWYGTACSSPDDAQDQSPGNEQPDPPLPRLERGGNQADEERQQKAGATAHRLSSVAHLMPPSYPASMAGGGDRLPTLPSRGPAPLLAHAPNRALMGVSGGSPGSSTPRSSVVERERPALGE